MKPFALARPKSLEEAHALLSATACPKGGGMDLLDLAKNGVSTPEVMVDLAGVPNLDGLDTQAGAALYVGGRVTLAELIADPEARRLCPALGDAASEAATPQVRNVATVAGNVLQRPRCPYFRDPFFDCLKRGGKTCPAMEGDHSAGAIFGNGKCCAVHPSNLAVVLLAARASITLSVGHDPKEGPKSRTVPVDPAFFVAPEEDPLREARVETGEIVWDFVVPACPASAYVEVDWKQSFDWASASAAVVLEMEGGKVKDARVALGAVAPVPLLSEAAAKALVGRVPDEAAAKAAADAAVKDAKPLRDNGHKVAQLRACVRRAVLKAAERGR
jgi:xanthine dehydrogenase YagS FAD-binding subunit